MKTRLTKTEKSRGVILPKNILKEDFIESEVKIELNDSQIILSTIEDIKRKGWGKAFKEMAANGDDQLVVPDLFADENITDWTFTK
ncbi:hypothetical protein [uncultured Mucilaginibacter sp.]|uniref:AbrB/MazE/SpoVT family DNA-binding domain-containing protein n=1 Tax=uncultured Mucilaginibacter sp. TaxID=797541 RepID=UPI0025D0DCF5|nr:hypothetical protein [uncultured Mucilaginibacter sp.]